MAHPDRPDVRKLLLPEEHPQARDTAGSIDIAACATILYSSEHPEHPIENLLDDHGGAGGTRWASARQNATEQIVIAFDTPRSISRLVYEVEEAQFERTQEIRVELSRDAGRTYQQVLVQEYTFSPQGATLQREDLRLDAEAVSQLRLTIMPHKSGNGIATLTSLRLYS